MDKKEDGKERESLIKRQTEGKLENRVESEIGENQKTNRNKGKKIRF